jgi:hypothetical protein
MKTLISVQVPAVPQTERPTFFFELADFEKYDIPKPNLPVLHGQNDDLILQFHDHNEMLDYYGVMMEKRYYENPAGEQFQRMKVIIDYHAAVYQFELIKAKFHHKTYLTAENDTPYKFVRDTMQIGDQAPLKFRFLKKQGGFFLEYGPAKQLILVMEGLCKTIDLKTPDGKPIAHLRRQGQKKISLWDY